MAGIHKEVIPVAALAALLVPLSAQADTVPGQIIVQVGDTPTGATLPIADVRRPFVNGNNQVAFVGLLADGGLGDAYVFVDDQVVYQNSFELTESLSGTEIVMGADNSGGFAFGTDVNGLDSIWTNNGLLFSQGDAPPGTPVGVLTNFQSDPRVLDDGTIYWRAGFDNGEVALFRTPTGLPGDAELVVMSSDTLDGEEIETLRSDYTVSQDGSHFIQTVFLVAAADADFGLYLDNTLTVREGTVSNVGDEWSTFGLVTVNNSGDWLTYATLESDPLLNATLTYNGNVVIREGDTVDGILITEAVVRLVGLNNVGRAAYAFGGNGTAETVFYACNSGDISASSIRRAQVGDEIDIDDDQTGDFTLVDLNEGWNLRGQGLADDGVLYLEVDIDYNQGAGPIEAILALDVECCGNSDTDPGEQCDDGNDVDDDDCTNACALPDCPDGIQQTGEECDDGNMVDDDGCTNACTLPACPDGVQQAGEECDDGNMVDDDACTNMCELPDCPDGIQQAGEECDDGNDVDDDGCTNACTLPDCGDGIAQSGEECDDGNDTDDDLCTNNCTDPACGDGVTQAGEGCDDGNNIDNDECTNLCALPTCGDAILHDGEECDDGNDTDDDFCTNNCTAPTCGDGVAQAGEECDDGNGNDFDECTSTCDFPTCGDGFVHPGLGEACDDGNNVPGDGCDPQCFFEDGEETGTTTTDGDSTSTGGDDTTTTISDEESSTGDDESSSGGDGGAAGDDDGCGCDAGQRKLPGAMWLGVALLALRRRRD